MSKPSVTFSSFVTQKKKEMQSTRMARVRVVFAAAKASLFPDWWKVKETNYNSTFIKAEKKQTIVVLWHCQNFTYSIENMFEYMALRI